MVQPARILERPSFMVTIGLLGLAIIVALKVAIIGGVIIANIAIVVAYSPDRSRLR